MKSNGTKLLLGFLVGAAVGTAIGFLLSSDKKEELLDDLSSKLDSTKKKLSDVVKTGIEDVGIAVDKLNSIANTMISRTKSYVSDSKEKDGADE